MADTNVLSNIFSDPTLWERMIAAEKQRLERIKQEQAARPSLPNCARCKTSKVYKAGYNVCLSCSYC